MAALILDPGSPLNRTADANEKVEEIIMSNPEVDQELAFIGYDIMTGSLKSNYAAYFILLKPWHERKGKGHSAGALIKRLSADVNSRTADALFVPFNPPAVQGLSTTGGLEGYVQNKGSGGSAELSRKTAQFIEKALGRPELSSVTTTFNTATPQYDMKTNEIKARNMGVSLTDLYVTMQSVFGGVYVNDFTKFGRSFKVLMQAESNYRTRPEKIQEVFVRSSNGGMVPVSALAELVQTTGADSVERFNLFPSAKIMAQPAPGYSSGQAIKAMEETAAEVLGADYGLSWFGTAFQEKQSGSTSMVVLLLALIVVFLILAAQYESWSLPFAVLSAVPFGLFGAFLGVFGRGLYNDIYFQIALVVLIGLAAKNAILIVEFAVELKRGGMNFTESAVQACRLRFRPIVMTSLAFILGCVPLMISSGAGAASRHSIGTAVVFGMLGATILAPLFVPLFYVLIFKLTARKDI